MLRRFVCCLGIVALSGLPMLAADSPRPNMLRDGGFESVSRGRLRHWSVAGSWPGKLSVVTASKTAHGGRRCAQLEASERQGRWFGRAFQGRQPDMRLGARYRLSIWAKGKGELVVGGIEYRVDDKGKRSYIYQCVPEPARLTDDWQRVVFDYAPQEPTITLVRFYAEVRGQGGTALLDDAYVGLNPKPGHSFRVRASHTMMPMNGSLPIDLIATGPEGPAGGAVSMVLRGHSAGVRRESIDLNVKGHARCALNAAETGIVTASFVHIESGLPDRVYVDVVDQATYSAFARVAQGVSVPSPAHVMFVGDSLTALFRGYNYVDKVRGWLQHRYGDSVKVTNAGVGGDYTTRVLKRLDSDVLAHKPSHVFVFLGHNDSKLKSTTEYKEAVVPPEQFAAEYRQIVGRIQKEIGAKVTIMSATSSVYEITKASADKRRAAGKAHNLFGKPEALEQFNAIARKVAQDLGADYLDVYEPTRTHPDKPSLFTKDGVHVSNKGNQLLAIEILKYLANK